MAASVMVALIIAGCGSGEGDEVVAGPAPAGQSGGRYEREPWMDAEVPAAAFVGLPGDVDGAALGWFAVFENLIGECMGDAGFDYFPLSQSPEGDEANVAYQDQLDVESMARYHETRFGSPESPGCEDQATPGSSVVQRFPQESSLASEQVMSCMRQDEEADEALCNLVAPEISRIPRDGGIAQLAAAEILLIVQHRPEVEAFARDIEEYVA